MNKLSSAGSNNNNNKQQSLSNKGNKLPRISQNETLITDEFESKTQSAVFDVKSHKTRTFQWGEDPPPNDDENDDSSDDNDNLPAAMQKSSSPS